MANKTLINVFAWGAGCVERFRRNPGLPATRNNLMVAACEDYFYN